MEKVLILRHGESEKFKGTKGQQDIPLSRQGRAFMGLIAQILQIEQIPYELVISSPLKQAIESASILNTKRVPQIVSPSFNELDVGSLSKKAEGMPLSEYDKLARQEGAETSSAALGRMLEGLAGLKPLEAKNGLLVTHSIVMNLLAYGLSQTGGLQVQGPFEYGCGFLVNLETMQIESVFPPESYFEE